LRFYSKKKDETYIAVLCWILLVLFTIWSIAVIALLIIGTAVVSHSIRQGRQQNFDLSDFLSNIQDQQDILQNFNQNQNNFNQHYGNTIQTITIVLIVVWIIGLSIANAMGYYIWDIVKSAYKQIKEENRTNQHAYEMTARNTYEQKPPAYYAPA
jgi:uncharacterized membrane protein SpoIIM required for sporulation